MNSHFVSLPWNDLETLSPTAIATLCDGFHRDGLVKIVELGAIANDVWRFYRDCRGFFRRPTVEKLEFQTGTAQGYLRAKSHETFEVKKHRRAPNFRIPEEMEGRYAKVYDVFEVIARTCFKAISIRMTGDERFLKFLDDSTFRILFYDGVYHGPEELIQRAFADHTDSSFLTVVPKSTTPALDMKTIQDEQWINIEEELKDDELCVFISDCTSRLTNNYFPAILHRPLVRAMREDVTTRVSTPFFLRGFPEAELDVSQCRADLIGPVDPSIQKPITIDQIMNNTSGCRDNWPWKKNSYFSTFRYSSG